LLFFLPAQENLKLQEKVLRPFLYVGSDVSEEKFPDPDRQHCHFPIRRGINKLLINMT
jgi:hypothetical protein